jgi:two-component system, OmpR family, sensor histidine kinase SenX3
VEDVVGTWPQRRRLRARATPLQGDGGVIVVLQDVTDELRTQQIRRQFVANASHELKSPVAGLQALAEAIGQAARDDPDAAERFSSRLVSETHRLARLIADLLDLSRLEDPANAPVTEVNLSDVTSGIVTETAAAADAKSIRLNIDVEPNLFIRGDEQQLQLLVRNLVDNAVRYTPEGRSVTVELRHEDDHVVLRVADTGIGIALQAQGRIFERFYRVDRDRSRERGGTGLGLSIVKHVVELHGGHIELHSELGEGSTFTAHLPALRGARARARTVEPARAATQSSE